MTERSYGYRYSEAGERPRTADIARMIRADVKQAKAEGLLPLRWTYSVRSKLFAGGSSIDLEVRNCEDAWALPGQCLRYLECWGDNHYRECPAAEHLTDEAQSARMTLERIHGAYNHDGSDIGTDYFDVRYYGDVTFENASQREYRLGHEQRHGRRS